MPGADVAGRGGADADGADDSGASMGKLGVTVAPVTREDAARFDLTDSQRGLLVTDVAAGGPSWGELVGPDRGGPDIILEIEGKPVKSIAELRKALEGVKSGDIVSLRVYNTQAKNRRVERIKLGEGSVILSEAKEALRGHGLLRFAQDDNSFGSSRQHASDAGGNAR
jgi:hypothetical protein